MLKKVLSSIAGMLTIVAMSGASTASIWFVYEPDMPESLKKEL